MTHTRLDTTDIPAPEKTMKLEGNGKQALEQGRTRLLIAGSVFALAFSVIAARVIDVSVFERAEEPRLAEERGTLTHKTGRADIVDRNGMLLATTLNVPSLYADPKYIMDPAESAAKLRTVLPELDHTDLVAKFSDNKRFTWIKRNLTPRQQYAVNKLGIPGLYFQNESKRIYPQGRLTAHIVGRAGFDDVGLSGIEKSFDSMLRDGSDPLRLSIDVRIQHILREELKTQIDAFDGIGAAGIVMDVNSSEIVAMVSLPDFDPNRRDKISSDAVFNRATLGVYEMGSTFKIFNTAMALDYGTTTLHNGYDASKPIRVARFTINDDHAKNRWLSVPEIFMYSSNIGSVKMAMDVGGERQQAFMKKLGFLDSSAIELPERGHPLVPNPWRPINTMTISFGHGIAVSPIQLANGVSSIVNGGVRHPATLLRRDSTELLVGERVISEKTSHAMRRLLRLVVEKGTGRNANAKGYLVGGKTGTAEKPGRGGGYRHKALLSSFVAAFPVNDPRYVVLAMVDEPKGNKSSYGYATGGWVAAPAVKRIVERAAPFLNVTPVDEEAPEIRRALMVKIPPTKGKKALASF
ncbi:penicillin-binding protein 2 [uncultured Nisaea sp.]|jgi:cell division protein FtsI (penicillin-binding protein 3)|uniref:peptidoglycan D,D-transpeptidase FtsI family protein n=1 Tax=uncultured Nisaea sp. TaxID=538215 RepID=UPI0030EBA821|tara:strand:+ start:1861 stop:3597 length:1737 start_codon:yes stop_codon:yes gene_type:complete